MIREGNSRMETGISKLDECLGGGIPKGKSLVYYFLPGVDAEIFWVQTVYNTLKNGGTCIFIESRCKPDATKNQIKDLGWDIQPYIDRFICVDDYNPLISAQSKEKFVVSNPENKSKSFQCSHNDRKKFRPNIFRTIFQITKIRLDRK